MATATNGKSHMIPTAISPVGDALFVPKGGEIEDATADRLRAWIEWKRVQLGVSRYRLCVIAGIDPSTITKFVLKQRTIGLDVFIRLHRGLHLDATAMLDVDPPGHALPRPASPSPQPERQRRTAGK